MKVKFIGFAPDLEPTTPGAILEASAIIPTLTGYRAAASGVNAPQGVLAGPCFGAYLALKLDGTRRTFAGTATALYEAATSSWTDRTRSVGGAYSAGADSRWRFTQFGNASLAINKGDVLQVSTSGSFADISGAPKAAIVTSNTNFVLLFNTNEGTFGDSPNRWWCSALGDHTSWTPSAATQAASGTLDASPGPITAAHPLGDTVIAYKRNSMYVGQYQGPPVVWAWPLLPGAVGAPSHESVVNIDTAHIFPGSNDFYIFDGTRAQPLNAPCRDYFFDNLDQQFENRILGVHDREKYLVRFYFPSPGSNGQLNKGLVYNYRTNTWGVDDRTVQAAVESSTAAITYDGLGALFATYHDMPAIIYDSPFWNSATNILLHFNSANMPQTLTGVAGSSHIVWNDIGDNDAYTFVRRVRPHYKTATASATLQNFHRDQLGAALTADATVSQVNGKFDFMRVARWHRFRLDFTGDMEIVAADIDVTQAGLE